MQGWRRSPAEGEREGRGERGERGRKEEERGREGGEREGGESGVIQTGREEERD